MTLEENMRRWGATEREIQQAICEHDYGNMCESTFMGCVRTCQKCGQMLGAPLYFGEAMSGPHYVYFQCLTCGWVHHVPRLRIALVGGLPRSSYVPFHQCEGVADVEERGGFDANLLITQPGWMAKITL